MDRLKLFGLAYMQVFLVCINTYFISKGYILGIFICSFMISFIWCFNVAKVSISSLSDKFIYAYGASFGGVSGFLVGNLIT